MQENMFNNVNVCFSEKLVKLVGKHKILYDSTTEGYSNFQLQDEIWRKIASELNEDVAACKLKWKNIRSCYTRYLRQISLQKRRLRTYYLAKHLRFLLPFCKPNTRQIIDSSSLEEISSAAINFENSEIDSNDVCKAEPLEEEEEQALKTEADVSLDESNSEHLSEVNSNNKRPIWETNSEFEFSKVNKISENDVAEMNFFRSLLPDIHKMNGKQKNKLKIAILGAINDILYGDES